MNENETKNDGATPGVAESNSLRGDAATPSQAGSKFYAALVSWGVPAVVAAAIVGAVYAALVALGVLSLPGCTVSVDVLPDGGQHWEGSVTLPAPVTANPAK